MKELQIKADVLEEIKKAFLNLAQNNLTVNYKTFEQLITNATTIEECE